MTRLAFRDFRAERKAATTMLFALVAPILIGTAALATDMGELYLRKRSLQAAVDAAALAAAAHPDIAATVARKILNAAGETEATLAVEFGAWNPAAANRDARFVAGQAGNAIRVDAKRKSPPRLSSIFTRNEFEIGARAEAALAPVVSLSVGSRLASAEAGLLGSLLSAPLGTSFDLSASDYAALSRSKIELGALVEAVAPASPTVADALQAQVRVTNLFAAMANEMGHRVDFPAMAALRKAATRTAQSSSTLQLSRILRLDDAILGARTDYPSPAMQIDLSVADLFSAAMRQVGAGGSFESSIALPGIGSAEIALQIGEAGLGTRAVAVSEHLPLVEADVVRLRARIATSGLLDILQTKLDLPIEIVTGGGTAQVTNVRCTPNSTDRQVTVSVRPGLIKLALGRWSTPIAGAGINQKLPPAEILTLLGTGIEAQSYIQAGSLDPITVTFNGSEIANGTVKSVRTTNLAQSLVGSLFGQAEYSVRGLPVLGLVQKVGTLLTTLVAPVDQLLNGVLSVAGIGLGVMDIRIDGLVCKQSRIIG